MKAKDLIALGVPQGEPIKAAFLSIKSAVKAGFDSRALGVAINSVVDNPDSYRTDKHFRLLAQALLSYQPDFIPRTQLAPWKQWGIGLEAGAIKQMRDACELPISVVGALMPDAHQGYGLPIGGVLATTNSVIPFAVGVDIACRMKMTILDLSVEHLKREHQQRLTQVIEKETRFGIAAHFKNRREHPVIDDKDWHALKITRRLKDKAWQQLGTSGSGNHFVEFGIVTFDRAELGLQPGMYVALLSHSGSRGPGAQIANHYSKLARSLHRKLPKHLQFLAWLDLNSEAGQEYWLAMQLMGKYAAANHDCIHKHIAKELAVLVDIENHHNFAWKQQHNGEEVIVHRKGATPAGEGVLGIIPGTMADSAYLVKGKGNPESLHSASHGAGRRMSRTAAKQKFVWSKVKKQLEGKGVTVISAGIDEVPGAYKDINTVMSQQTDLVEPIAVFQPKLVKMASDGR